MNALCLFAKISRAANHRLIPSQPLGERTPTSVSIPKGRSSRLHLYPDDGPGRWLGIAFAIEIPMKKLDDASKWVYGLRHPTVICEKKTDKIVR